jgi:hypothetical protein
MELCRHSPDVSAWYMQGQLHLSVNSFPLIALPRVGKYELFFAKTNLSGFSLSLKRLNVSRLHSRALPYKASGHSV